MAINKLNFTPKKIGDIYGIRPEHDWNPLVQKVDELVDAANSNTGGDSRQQITEKKLYYNGEYGVGKALSSTADATFGNIIVNANTNITNFMAVEGNEVITMSTTDASQMNVFGITYDSTGTPISAIRSAASFTSTLSTYTFTTPANAAYLIVYTKYLATDWGSKLKIESSGTATYKYPILPEDFTGTDSQKINSALRLASVVSCKKVVLNYTYSLTEAIIIPGKVTLVNNGNVKMAVGMHDNIIRNGATRFFTRINPAPDTQIRILGNGTYEGSDEAWGSDTPTGVSGQSWRAIGILLANVDEFEISGITVKETHCWGICCEQSRYGKITDITFSQTGKHPNQDGVDIRRGCHNISVTHIKGTCHDDIVAVTNIQIRPDINILGTTIYENGAPNLNIHDIVIKDIVRKYSNIFVGVTPTHYGGGILLLCEDGLKIYSVTVDGVTSIQQICVGFTFFNYVQTTAATVNDMYNISISNTGEAPIYLNRPIKNSSFVNVSRTDVNGVYNAVVPKTGSLNITRKYHDGDKEFFATV